jgi:hypothetical protein
MTLHLVPVTLKTANDFVAAWHRHNLPVLGSICSVGVADDEGSLRGVAIVGRPTARKLCDEWTAEVTRTCTDGAANANSMLYGAAWRAARALGYRRLVTYTQHAETGASLRAAGWKQAASLPATKGWSRPSRQRDNNLYESADRWRWEVATAGPYPPSTVEQVEDVPDLFSETVR